MSEPRRLAAYVQPSLSEGRIQAQWSRIVERQARWALPRVWWYAGSVVALAVCVVVIGYAVQRPSTPQASRTQPSQVVVERDGFGQQTLRLPEGLSVTLRAQARYRLLERSNHLVHVLLEGGAAEFDVTPERTRRVVVTAAGFDVEVVGTRFTVELLGKNDAPDVTVVVHRGTVRVRPRGNQGEVLRTLAEGESWATSTHSAASGSASSLPEAATGEVSVAVAPAPAAPVTSVVSAKELFESAESSRLKGRLRESATALDRLRRTFPSDPRAGLACFELGRLRMDQLGDPAGALGALSDAMRLDPSARFREEAQARIVQLHARLGQMERCRSAQAEYQARFPRGAYGNVVGRQCSP